LIPGRPSIAELDQLQRKTHAARRALNSVQSETRAALQLVAQVDDEISALRTAAQPDRAQQPPAQPEEAQHAHEARQAAHA
jgi:hypothetical protein